MNAYKSISAIFCKALPAFCFLLFTFYSFAQTEFEPPALNCVKQSGGFTELYWDIPVSRPCFDSYEIWYSIGNKGGPYSLFTTVTDPLQTNISVNVSLANTAYFYMIQRGSCVNPAPPDPKTSDTLDNAKPQPPIELVNVSVVNGHVEINWLPGSREVVAYIVYSNLPGQPVGSKLLDTVYGRFNNTYTDTFNTPSKRQIQYGIRALEFCEDPAGYQGTLTPDSMTHGTAWMRLSDINICTETVSVTWDPYKFKTSNAVNYEIQMNVNGAGFNTVGSADSNTTVFLLQNLPSKSDVCIRLKANLPNGAFAYSNDSCFHSDALASIKNDYIRNVTVDGNNVIIEYVKDTASSPFRNIILQRSPDGSIFTPVTISPPDSIGPFMLQLIDGGANVNQHLSYYSIQVNDDCGNRHFSDTAATLYLNVKEKRGNIGDIQWRGFDVQNADFVQFSLVKIIGTDTTLVGTFGRNSSSYQLADLFDYSADTVQDICFRITAEFYNLNDKSPRELLYSHSNISCVTPVPKLFMPNAFAPGGFNKTIKPFLLLARKDGYKYTLIDRWNHIVFSTENADEAWDGKYKGIDAPFDSYVFIVEFTGKDGQTYKETGTIMLIR